MSHEFFEEILDQPMPEYVSERGVKGLLGWVDTVESIDPQDELATYGEQVAVRQTWMACCRMDVLEAVLCTPGGFSGALMNQFDRFYDFVQDNLGQLENLNQCWDYESFVQELTTICIQSFQSAKAVYEDILAHAECLETISGMGMRLSDEEKVFLRAIRATKQGE